jgi:hypothetical protein
LLYLVGQLVLVHLLAHLVVQIKVSHHQQGRFSKVSL